MSRLHSTPSLPKHMSPSSFNLKSVLYFPGVAQWIECQPVNQRVAGSIPSWGTCQVPGRGCSRGNHTLMFLCLSFSFPPPLSKNKLIKPKKRCPVLVPALKQLGNMLGRQRVREGREGASLEKKGTYLPGQWFGRLILDVLTSCPLLPHCIL